MVCCGGGGGGTPATTSVHTAVPVTTDAPCAPRTANPSNTHYPDGSATSHGKSALPDTSKVFPEMRQIVFVGGPFGCTACGTHNSGTGFFGRGHWSDVASAINALHQPDRLIDPAAWRSRLSAVFNVDGFLKWTAANAVLGIGDSYGFIAHNYSLYADAATGRYCVTRLTTLFCVRSICNMPPTF